MRLDRNIYRFNDVVLIELVHLCLILNKDSSVFHSLFPLVSKISLTADMTL